MTNGITGEFAGISTGANIGCPTSIKQGVVVCCKYTPGILRLVDKYLCNVNQLLADLFNNADQGDP